MSEYFFPIFILCAGEGSRLGIGAPKCFAQIAENETILDRTIRLLLTIGAHAEQIIIVICNQPEKFYKWRKESGLAINLLEIGAKEGISPQIPRGETLSGIKDVLERSPGIKEYAFVLGDVVWTESTLREFLCQTLPICFYADSKFVYGETFGIKVMPTFNKTFRELLQLEEIMSYRGIPKQFNGVQGTAWPLIHCKLGDLFWHCLHLLKVTKVMACESIKDIDFPNEFEEIKENLKQGFVWKAKNYERKQ